MGLKRIMFAAEATFPADDPRSFEELAAVVLSDTRDGIHLATHEKGPGTLAAFRVTGAFTDPDPVGQLPDPQPGDTPPVTPPSDV